MLPAKKELENIVCRGAPEIMGDYGFFKDAGQFVALEAASDKGRGQFFGWPVEEEVTGE